MLVLAPGTKDMMEKAFEAPTLSASKDSLSPTEIVRIVSPSPSSTRVTFRTRVWMV